MKTIVFLLLSPLSLWAQVSVLKPLRTDTLKTIGTDLIPVYGRYGAYTRSKYTYDGLDVRHTRDLGQYIMASGDPDAMREFKAYTTSRHAGGWLITVGILGMVIGLPTMLSNRPDTDGGFHTYQAFQCPAGQYCAIPVGGGGYSPVKVPDTQRQNAYSTGGVFLLTGALLAGIGWRLCMPGQHLRRSVQYYNRALKQQGISWKLTPYSSYMSSGIGLTGRF